MDQTLDPRAQTLTQAIAMQEGGGSLLPYDNKSGDFPNAPQGTAGGRYQFTPNTWKANAQEILGDSNAPFTPENQNKVAYTKVKQWLDSGYTPAQVASMWNAGPGAPDAWKPGTQQKVGDTPDYVKNVQKYAQQLSQKTGGYAPPNLAGTQPQVSTQGNNGYAPPRPPAQSLQTDVDAPMQRSVTPGNPTGSPSGIGSLATGAKNVESIPGELSGALNFAAPILPDLYNDATGGSKKTLGQQAADLGITGLDAAMFIPGLQPEDLAAQAGLRGTTAALAGNAAAGAALGGLGSISNGDSGAQGIGKGALTGGLLGGAAGAVAPTLSHWLDVLPTSLVKMGFKGTDTNMAENLLKKPLGTVGSLLKNSTETVNEAGSKVNSILSDSKLADAGVGDTNSLTKTANKFSGNKNINSIDDVVKRLQSIVPDQTVLLDKLAAGTATLAEKNTLRQALDKATYRGLADLPALTSKKVMAHELANNLRNEIKGYAADTIPYFDQMSKEIPLQKVLAKMDKSSAAHLGLFDVLSAMTGLAGSPLAGAALDVGTRVARTPSALLGAGKAIRGIAPLVKLGGTAGKAGLIRASTSNN